MNTIAALVGRYEGTGTWHDAAGKTAAYTVEQAITLTKDGFEVAFKHDFDDGEPVRARFEMTFIAPNLFRVEASGVAIGNGYLFDGYCHYHMKAGEPFVEASYCLVERGLDVFGSSSTNAEGLYIAWRETLVRIAATTAIPS